MTDDMCHMCGDPHAKCICADDPPPPFPEDEVVDGVKLTFCCFCADLAGGRDKPSTEFSVLLKKCDDYKDCLGWKKKE